MPAAIPHTEQAFEELIVSELTGDGGWIGGDPKGYDAALGLYPEDAIGFVTETQRAKWDRLVKLSGGGPSASVALLKRSPPSSISTAR